MGSASSKSSPSTPSTVPEKITGLRKPGQTAAHNLSKSRDSNSSSSPHSSAGPSTSSQVESVSPLLLLLPSPPCSLRRAYPPHRHIDVEAVTNEGTLRTRPTMAAAAATATTNQVSAQGLVRAARNDRRRAQGSTGRSRRGHVRQAESPAAAIHARKSVAPPPVCDDELPCGHRPVLRRRAAFVMIPSGYRRRGGGNAQPEPEAGTEKDGARSGEIRCYDGPALRGMRKRGQVPLQVRCGKPSDKGDAEGVEDAEDAAGARMLGGVKGIRKRVPGPLGMGPWRADGEAEGH